MLQLSHLFIQLAGGKVNMNAKVLSVNRASGMGQLRKISFFAYYEFMLEEAIAPSWFS